jgi:ribosomal protein L12E/L44/L45/RPP1/RPP2
MPFVVAPEEKAELACTFAALILHDDGLKVDSDNISKLLTAANVQIEPYWPKLYASMLAGKKIGDLISAAAAPSGDAAPAAAPAEGGKKADGKADKKDGKADKKDDKGKKDGGDKKDKKPKDDDAPAEGGDEPDMGFSLFD